MKKLAIICIIPLLFSCQERSNSSSSEMEEESKHMIDSLEHYIDSLQLNNLDLKDRLSNIEAIGKTGEKEVDKQHIINELKNNTELIKMESVLGGKMHFSDIKVLNKRWIMATYEDGHVQGRSIFRYKIRPDSSIQFTVLDSIEHY